MNKKTWILILIALVIVLVGAYLVWWKYYSTPVYKSAPSQQEIEKTVQPEIETPIQNLPSTEEKSSLPVPAPVKSIPVPVPAKTYTVNIANFVFSSASITINKGDTVIWINKDSAPHTVTGSGFDSSTLNKDQNFSFKFNASGTYNYICNFHPYMKGSVIVK